MRTGVSAGVRTGVSTGVRTGVSAVVHASSDSDSNSGSDNNSESDDNDSGSDTSEGQPTRGVTVIRQPTPPPARRSGRRSSNRGTTTAGGNNISVGMGLSLGAAAGGAKTKRGGGASSSEESGAPPAVPTGSDASAANHLAITDALARLSSESLADKANKTTSLVLATFDFCLDDLAKHIGVAQHRLNAWSPPHCDVAHIFAGDASRQAVMGGPAEHVPDLSKVALLSVDVLHYKNTSEDGTTFALSLEGSHDDIAVNRLLCLGDPEHTRAVAIIYPTGGPMGAVTVLNQEVYSNKETVGRSEILKKFAHVNVVQEKQDNMARDSSVGTVIFFYNRNKEEEQQYSFMALALMLTGMPAKGSTDQQIDYLGLHPPNSVAPDAKDVTYLKYKNRRAIVVNADIEARVAALMDTVDSQSMTTNLFNLRMKLHLYTKGGIDQFQEAVGVIGDPDATTVAAIGSQIMKRKIVVHVLLRLTWATISMVARDEDGATGGYHSMLPSSITGKLPMPGRR